MHDLFCDYIVQYSNPYRCILTCGLSSRCLLGRHSFWDVDPKFPLLGGILSTSLVFCENSLIWRRSTSFSSFDSLEYSLQTKFIATSFSLGEVWNGVSTIVANSCQVWNFVRQFAAGSLTPELERRCAVWSSECVEESHGFTCFCAQFCGERVQGDHSSCLSTFEADPDFCSCIQSLDMMEITQQDYDNICVSSIDHPNWCCLEGMEKMH